MELHCFWLLLMGKLRLESSKKTWKGRRNSLMTRLDNATFSLTVRVQRIPECSVRRKSLQCIKFLCCCVVTFWGQSKQAWLNLHFGLEATCQYSWEIVYSCLWTSKSGSLWNIVHMYIVFHLVSNLQDHRSTWRKQSWKKVLSKVPYNLSEPHATLWQHMLIDHPMYAPCHVLAGFKYLMFGLLLDCHQQTCQSLKDNQIF